MTGHRKSVFKHCCWVAVLWLSAVAVGCSDADTSDGSVSNNPPSSNGGASAGGDIGPGDWDEDEIDPDQPIDEEDCEKFCNPYNVTVRNVCFQQEQTVEEGTQSCLRLCRSGEILQQAILCFIEFEEEMDCEELLRCLFG